MREGLPQLKSAGPSRRLFVSHVPYAGRLPVWVPVGLIGLFALFYLVVFQDLFAERAKLSGPALLQEVVAQYGQRLPRPISASVTLLRVEADGSQLVLTHEIKPEALSVRTPSREKENKRQQMLADACASAAYQALFADGVSLLLRFQSPEAALLLTVPVSVESCKLAAR